MEHIEIDGIKYDSREVLFCPFCGKKMLVEVPNSPQIDVGDGYVTRRLCKNIDDCEAVVFI